jgi:hypothetical protein
MLSAQARIAKRADRAKGHSGAEIQQTPQSNSIFQLLELPRSLCSVWNRCQRLWHDFSEDNMTWIRTIPLSEADDELRDAMEGQKALYPQEYAVPQHPAAGGGSLIVASHSLIPQALKHAFSTFGALMSPDLPLTRRQHEMIATMVSVTNRCVY